MQHRALDVQRLAVPVRRAGRVEALRELELGLGRDARLALEDEDLVPEEGIADDGEVGLCCLLSASRTDGPSDDV